MFVHSLYGNPPLSREADLQWYSIIHKPDSMERAETDMKTGTTTAINRIPKCFVPHLFWIWPFLQSVR